MSILAWIEDQRKLKLLNAPKYNHPASDGSKGLWTRCDHCGVILYIKHLKENQRVCFGCGYHLQMDSQERIDHLIDESTWRPLDETLSPCDPLEFRDQKLYTERLKDAQEKTGLQDAVQTGTGMLDGIPIALGVMDFHFMGGSMGSVVGEKITRLIEYAAQEGLTLVLVCASGGARMQEGIFSLMQMAKISSALQIYQSCANLLYISVLTSPTTGGVTASFAMLGDLIFAEPKALIGFAGRRVIEQTLQEDLPDDFQTSEYLLHHGLLDLIVPRCFLKQALSETITLYKDAPFKRIGSIPYGVQNRLYFLTEEKARRKWHHCTASLGTASSGLPVDGPGDGKLGESESDEYQIPLLKDTTFKATLATWLKDSSQDEPYRQILVSFQSMFSLFAANAASGSSPLFSETSTTQQSRTSREGQPAAVSHFSEPSARLSQETASEAGDFFQASPNAPLDGIPMAADLLASSGPADQDGRGIATDTGNQQDSRKSIVTHSKGGASSPQGSPSGGSSPLLELALGIGAEEGVAWRAFYANQKLSPKVMFLNHLNPGDSPDEDSKSAIYRKGEAEKRFFYRMILNNSRV